MEPILLATSRESYHNEEAVRGTEIRPMKSRLAMILLTGAVWLGNSPVAFGQAPNSRDVDKRSQSYISIPFDQRAFNKAVLQDRFDELQKYSKELDGLPQQLKDVAEGLLKNPQNPD